MTESGKGGKYPSSSLRSCNILIGLANTRPADTNGGNTSQSLGAAPAHTAAPAIPDNPLVFPN